MGVLTRLGPQLTSAHTQTHYSWQLNRLSYQLPVIKFLRPEVSQIFKILQQSEEDLNYHSTIFDHTSESSKHLLQVEKI